MSLSAQKVCLSVRSVRTFALNVGGTLTPVNHSMDLGIVTALAMLAVWAFATFTTEASGWIHALLTAGVFLLIWRIVVRGTPDPTSPKKKG